MSFKFKSIHTFEERKIESQRVMQKYPDRIPIVCEKSKNNNSSIPLLDKSKYLVPADLTVGQFMYVIRKRIKLNSEQAIFLFVNGTIPSTSAILYSLYDSCKDEDGFLYITYSGEITFGF